jgi:hypothetical protein
MKNLAELGDMFTLYVRWQGQDICFVLSASPQLPFLYKWLALAFQLTVSPAKY